MALISINFDTKEKTLDVKVNGKSQKNISYINIANYAGEDAHIEMTKTNLMEEDGMTERICIYANKIEHYKEPSISELSKCLGKTIGVNI